MPGFSRIKPGLPECAVLREKTHEKTVAAAAAASFAAVPSFAGDTAEDTCYGYFDGNNAEQHYPEALIVNDIRNFRIGGRQCMPIG